MAGVLQNEIDEGDADGEGDLLTRIDQSQVAACSGQEMLKSNNYIIGIPVRMIKMYRVSQNDFNFFYFSNGMLA